MSETAKENVIWELTEMPQLSHTHNEKLIELRKVPAKWVFNGTKTVCFTNERTSAVQSNL